MYYTALHDNINLITYDISNYSNQQQFIVKRKEKGKKNKGIQNTGM